MNAEGHSIRASLSDGQDDRLRHAHGLVGGSSGTAISRLGGRAFDDVILSAGLAGTCQSKRTDSPIAAVRFGSRQTATVVPANSA